MDQLVTKYLISSYPKVYFKMIALTTQLNIIKKKIKKLLAILSLLKCLFLHFVHQETRTFYSLSNKD